jgi:hypothetical protein
LGSSTVQVDDDDARDHRGVRYVATVADRDGFVIARREGYAGYDESRFANERGWRADWNNVCQMAQKRAVVSATKAALAASGLFADEDAPMVRTGSPPAPAGEVRKSAGGARSSSSDRVPDHVYDDLPEARG